MGKVFGKVTDAVGLTNYKGEKAAANAARDANAQANLLTRESIELQKEQLQFQKDQYKEWQSVYGDLQKNLGDYYKNLKADDLVALGLQNQQREFQAATEAIRRDAVKRGISGSGVEFAENARSTVQNATVRAAIRTTGAQQVAEQQMGFLGLGLGQGTQMLGLINNASSNVNAAYGTGINNFANARAGFLGQQTQLSSNNTSQVGQIAGAAMGWASGGTSMGMR